MKETAIKHDFTFDIRDTICPRLYQCKYCGFLTTTPQNNREDICHYAKTENEKELSA